MCPAEPWNSCTIKVNRERGGGVRTLCWIFITVTPLLKKGLRVTHWFDKRFRRECRAPEAWKVLRLVFLKPDAKLEKGIRGFRAVALISVMAKWYCSVVIGMLMEGGPERVG